MTINTKELPNSLLPKYKNCNLEDLLKIENAKARVITFGYDKYSGTRKVFESQQYTVDNIEEKFFEKRYYEE